MKAVIEAENISKCYRLGEIGSGLLSQDFERWLNRWRNKSDNWISVDETKRQFAGRKNEVIWSLNNISFQITKGEAIGIIGANGAGKSTLLKILSKVTLPTSGQIKGEGKVASLLEVGTGFHPELTGRDNIFLNGALLGMTKREIKRHFDEIVAFSGVEKYIDTPVKRYSSGMYVRLAFAVAAHLTPDILIIDEVLAVGDADFQKKCLGKMNEVTSREGRTIIFVSHNMQAISNLCSRAIWLDNGKIQANGPVRAVVNSYLGKFHNNQWKQRFQNHQEAPGNESIKVLSVELIPKLTDPLAPIDIRTELEVSFTFYNTIHNLSLAIELVLFDLSGDCIFDIPSGSSIYNEGMFTGHCLIPGNFLNDGSYFFSIYFAKDTSIPLFTFEHCITFDVADFRENTSWYEKWWGHVRPNFPLEIIESK